MKKYLSYIYVILSAVCWGFIGFSNRMLTEVGVSLGNRVFIRNFGTLLILTIVFALFHRQVFRIKLKHLPIFLCSGLLSILTLSLVYFQCQTMCSLSVAAVLLYLAPSFVVIFSAVLWKTPLTKRKLIALVVSLLGCVMVSGIIGGDMTASWAGIGLGVLSGLCYASYTVFAHYGLAHYESYTMIYWTFLVAGLGSVFFADFETLPLAFSGTQGIVGTCGVVIVATVLPYIFYTKGLEGTPNELKLKYLADKEFADLSGEELKNAISEKIKAKDAKKSLVGNMVSEGTTPRNLTDLIGSLCDLTSGSGDKGTPIVYIQGYFDNYTND